MRGRNKDRYRLWANSKTTAYRFGSGSGIGYTLLDKFYLVGNVTYAKLQCRAKQDGLEE
ncbi:hypothetical protein [Chryseosolibacter indicus]|uniref:Uncharacterized protein n=1 Tax=Chryseosolibacter indicus TaxID=2782351 RepID=A0ABS5VUD6_9BACT|nr:hypothetical protein [Chryseosolibacter indicus]MBT1704504.1 hypothetical protein [Chryseosolibacter indicus]